MCLDLEARSSDCTIIRGTCIHVHSQLHIDTHEGNHVHVSDTCTYFFAMLELSRSN